MKKVINWLIEPYKIVRTELKYLNQLKKDEAISKQEKLRIYKLQGFNYMFIPMYTIAFAAFLASTPFLLVGNWYSLSGIFVGLFMMMIIKQAQKNGYYKIRDAYIKNDPKMVKNWQ